MNEIVICYLVEVAAPCASCFRVSFFENGSFVHPLQEFTLFKLRAASASPSSKNV